MRSREHRLIDSHLNHAEPKTRVLMTASSRKLLKLVSCFCLSFS